MQMHMLRVPVGNKVILREIEQGLVCWRRCKVRVGVVKTIVVV